MRTIGLDLGEKRIGVAVSDPSGKMALGIEALAKAKSYAGDLLNLQKIFSKYDGISEICVGMPLTLKGEKGPAALKAEKFIEYLRQHMETPIKTWDERFTTTQAQNSLRELGFSAKNSRDRIDSSAAALMLQSYLDSRT